MAEVPNIFNPKESENIKKVATSLGELDKILVPMLDKLVNAQKILKENAITFNNVKKAQDSVKKSSVELDKVATKLKIQK